MNSLRHSHPMQLWSTDQKFECSKCKEFGVRQFYHCAHCNVHIHKACATALPFVVNPIDENCILEYQNTSTINRTCDACGKTISGSRYRYKPTLLSTSLNLHPRCAKLPTILTSEDGGGGIELHLAGDEWSKSLKGLKCVLCCRNNFSNGWSFSWGGGGTGWSYVSPCGEIGYHVSCVKDVIQESFKKGCFDNYININNNHTVCGPSTSQNQLGPRLGNQFALKITIKMAFELVFSAILGDPTFMVAHVITESLF